MGDSLSKSETHQWGQCKSVRDTSVGDSVSQSEKQTSREQCKSTRDRPVGDHLSQQETDK